MLLQSQVTGTLIDFTQGDTVTLALLATNDQGVPINLTGATFSTQIEGPNGIGPVTFGNSQHTAGNQGTAPGTFTLALTSTNTNACGLGPNKEIITEVTISGNITYFRGPGLLTVYCATPNP